MQTTNQWAGCNSYFGMLTNAIRRNLPLYEISVYLKKDVIVLYKQNTFFFFLEETRQLLFSSKCKITTVWLPISSSTVTHTLTRVHTPEAAAVFWFSVIRVFLCLRVNHRAYQCRHTVMVTLLKLSSVCVSQCFPLSRNNPLRWHRWVSVVR